MFDFAFSEIALIGIVALIAIGPKDLPVAIKAVTNIVKKARRMAGEFQTHVDEMVREADLGDVRDQFNELRRMDIKGKILDAVDGDKTIRNTIRDNPLDINPAPPPVPVLDSAPAPLVESSVAALPEPVIAAPAEAASARSSEAALAFLPPAVQAAGPPASRRPAPAFVPPAVVAASSSRSNYASPYAA